MQLASVVGIFGVSALVASASAALAGIVAARAYRAAALVLAGTLLIAVWGNARVRAGDLTREGRPIRVGLVQGNVDQGQKWNPARGASIFGDYLRLTQQAELILVAPATANVIGKLANGLGDNFVSDLLLGATCPVLLAPAMNTRMLNHPAVQRNLKQLDEWGFRFVGPASGWLACREEGAGRMSEPTEIVAAVRATLTTDQSRSKTS